MDELKEFTEYVKERIANAKRDAKSCSEGYLEAYEEMLAKLNEKEGCKDCIHYAVCIDDGSLASPDYCGHFSNAEDWKYLPDKEENTEKGEENEEPKEEEINEK